MSRCSKWHAYSITRFNLRFDILPDDKLEAARTGNWFLETNRSAITWRFTAHQMGI